MKISLTTAISGKSFVIFEFLNGIRSIIRSEPNIEWYWVICNTSKNPSIKARLLDCAKELGIPYKYVEFEAGAEYKDYFDQNSVDCIREYMPKLMNYMMSFVPDCDYVLNVEDDIVCKHEKPIPLLLGGFSDDVAAVVGLSYVRRLAEHFGEIQHFQKKMFKRVNMEYKDSGYEQVDRSAFGFIMIRYEYSKMPFVSKFGDAFAFDPAFSERMKALGKKIILCWDIKTKHYFMDESGIVGFVDETIERNKEKMVTIQWPRRESPLFLTVPESVVPQLTEETVGAYLHGAPLY